MGGHGTHHNSNTSSNNLKLKLKPKLKLATYNNLPRILNSPRSACFRGAIECHDLRGANKGEVEGIEEQNHIPGRRPGTKQTPTFFAEHFNPEVRSFPKLQKAPKFGCPGICHSGTSYKAIG